MKPIIILMLCVQVAIFLIAAFQILFRKSELSSGRPVWSIKAMALVVVSLASWSVASNHQGREGADILQFGASVLFGMALGIALMSSRWRRDTDARP